MKFQEKLIFKRGKYYTSVKKQCRLSYIQLRESLIIESKGITTSGDNPEKTFLNAGGSVSPFSTPQEILPLPRGLFGLLRNLWKV